MKFGDFIIQNFMSISKATLNLADRGFYAINGVNESNSSASSNGSGKSSIADALFWVITGSTARKIGADEVVNNEAGKNTMVEIHVYDDVDYYIIRRHRKHKVEKNALQVFKRDLFSGVDTDLTLGTTDLTQDLIYKIIGCSHEVFVAAYLAAQEKMPSLPDMTDKELKMLVEEAAGVNVLESAYKEASDRLTAIKRQIEDETKRATAIKTAILTQQQSIESSRKSYDEFEAKRTATLNTIRADIKVQQSAYNKAKGDVAAMDPAAVEREVADCNATLSGVTAEYEAVKEQQTIMVRAQTTMNSIQAELNMHNVKVSNLEEAVANVSKIVGTPCTKCGKTYCSEDIEDAKKIAESDLIVARDQQKSIENALRIAIQTFSDARTELSKQQAALTDVSAVQAALAQLELRRGVIRKYEDEMKNALNKAKTLMEQIKATDEQPNPFSKLIDGFQSDLTKKQNEEKIIDDGLKALNEKLEIAQAVVKVFSPAGVRAHILDNVTPFLNDQTAKYLGTLTDGNTVATWSTLIKNAKGELKEKFSIEVSDDKGGKTFGSMSGGERRKARIATSLALQDLVARRASKPLNIFIGDEIDDALDPAGLERLATILKEKSKDCGSVFIISHNNLDDWVDGTITVTKRADNISYVEEK